MTCVKNFYLQGFQSNRLGNEPLRLATKIVPDFKKLLRKICFSLDLSATRNETIARQGFHPSLVSAILNFHFRAQCSSHIITQNYSQRAF